MRAYFRETIDGFIFWSFFQALAPMIWFYPLNDLEISGYEAFAGFWFFPVVCGVPVILGWFRTRWGLLVLRLLSVACLSSFKASTTLTRLVILATGCGLSMIIFTVSITHPSQKIRSSFYRGLIFGLFAFLSTRIWFLSFVPTWWTANTNSSVIALGVAASIDLFLSSNTETANENSENRAKPEKKSTSSENGENPKIIEKKFTSNQNSEKRATTEKKSSNQNSENGAKTKQISSSNENSAKTEKTSSSNQNRETNEKKSSDRNSEKPNWFLVGLGLGSLLFDTHWCFGEVSLISRWVVSGHPDPGPEPVPWGALILLALFAGVILSDYEKLTRSYLWWIVGAASLTALYRLPTYLGFAGGVIHAVYAMSVWPQFIGAFSKCPPARTAFVTMATYISQVLYSVWTVAYNFVPGGEYTREATGYLIGCVMLFILLAGIANRKSSDSTARLSNNSGRSMKVWLFLIVLVGLCGIGHRHRLYSEKLATKHAPRKQFSSAIWTYHFGYDNQGWPSLERSAKMLQETGADVITLLESDASKTFLGNNDIGSWLGEMLGMHVDFGVSTRDHTWGNLILSKYPIVKSTPHLLPSPKGELAPAITATINISGTPIDFVVTHMGNDRDFLDRKLQAKFLANETRTCVNPVVFMGYVTSAPGSHSYKTLLRDGNMKDIDRNDEDRWCEYIFYRGLIRLGYARISHGGLSDTELQMAKFRIPDDLSNFKDNVRTTLNPKNVAKDVQFNPYFGSFYHGHGYFENHHFHMMTPKYFL